MDFEGLRAASRDDFTAFLTDLSREVHNMGKTLYVCVSPVLSSGPYYDGYDYRAISGLADQVILMAYDYDARDLSGFEGTEYYKNIAPAPIDQVFMSLEAITSTVQDPGKIALGFSCKNIAWQIDENERLVSGKPLYPTRHCTSGWTRRIPSAAGRTATRPATLSIRQRAVSGILHGTTTVPASR